MTAWLGRTFRFIPAVRRWHSRRYLPALQSSYHEGQVILASIPESEFAAKERMSAQLAFLETLCGASRTGRYSMNGLAAEHFQADCPLANCHWISEPLPSAVAAQESRRKHVSGHTQGELVGYVCANRTEVARYDRAEPA